MNLPPKKLFLIDGLGALVSALLFVFLVARFENVFGMPQDVVYVLSGIAVVFFVYSLGCYFLVQKNQRIFLLLVALANILYCVATIVLLIYFSEKITALGFTYFAFEIVIISTVVWLELKTVWKPALTA